MKLRKVQVKQIAESCAVNEMAMCVRRSIGTKVAPVASGRTGAYSTKLKMPKFELWEIRDLNAGKIEKRRREKNGRRKREKKVRWPCGGLRRRSTEKV